LRAWSRPSMDSPSSSNGIISFSRADGDGTDDYDANCDGLSNDLAFVAGERGQAFTTTASMMCW
jgi:hypothetical protein